MNPNFRWGLILILSICTLQVIGQEKEKGSVLLHTVEVFDEAEQDSSHQQPTLRPTGQPEEILAAKPGFDLIYRGAYAPEVNYQGMAASRMAITINGMRVFSACTDRMDPVTSYVDAINLDEAQLSPSGSGAGHAQLNLTLSGANIPFGWSGTFQAYGHEGRKAFGSSIKLNFRNDRSFLNISSAYRKADNYLDPNRDPVAFTQYNKTNFAMTAGHRFGEDHRFEAEMIIDDAWDIGYAGLPMDVAYARGKIFGFTHKWRIHRDLLQTKVYLNTIQHAMDDTQRPDVAMHMDMPGWSNTQGGFMKWSRFGEPWVLEAKLEFFANRQRAEMTMYPEDEIPMYMLTWPDVRRMTGMGIIGIRRNWKKINFHAEGSGSMVRYHVLDDFGIDQMSVFGYDISNDRSRRTLGLTLSGDIKINPGTTVTLSSGFGQRAPTTSEMYGFYLYNASDGFDYIGDPDIHNEKDLNVQLSGRSQLGKWTLTYHLGGHFLQDYIYGEWREDWDPMTIGARGVRQYVNLDKARLLSMDGRVSRNWGSIGFGTGFSYTYGDKGSVDEPLPLIAPPRGWATLTYDLRGHLFRFSQVYTLEQNRTDNELGELPSGGWTTSSISWEKHWAPGGHDLLTSIGVENLFNESYTDHLDWGRIIRPGRNLYFKIQFDLWKKGG